MNTQRAIRVLQPPVVAARALDAPASRPGRRDQALHELPLPPFYLLSLTLRTMPVGIVYAVWSGLGIVLIAAVGAIWLRQPLDLPAIVGPGLILAGIVVVNVFSKTVGH